MTVLRVATVVRSPQLFLPPRAGSWNTNPQRPQRTSANPLRVKSGSKGPRSLHTRHGRAPAVSGTVVMVARGTTTRCLEHVRGSIERGEANSPRTADVL